MARAFDGTSGFGRSSATPLTGTPFTVAMRVKLGAYVGGNDATFFSLGNSGDTDDFYKLYSVNASNRIRAQSCAAGTAANAQTSLDLNFVGNWRHIAGVFSSATERRAYVTNLKGTDATNIAPAPTDQLAVAALLAVDVASEYAQASIAEVGLWSIALTDGEIAQLVAGCTPPMIHPEFLVAYWPLWGAHSPEIELLTGAYPLTLAGTADSAEGPPTALLRPRTTWIPRQASAVILPSGGMAVKRRRVGYL